MTHEHEDEFETLIRRADPVRARNLPAPHGAEASRLLSRARRGGRRARTRRLMVLPAVAALAVGGATAAGVAWVAGDGEGHALDTTAVDCKGPNGDAHLNFNAVRDDPAELCAQDWRKVFEEPAPADLVACVDSSQQGSIQVYPGRDESTCAEHRADPWNGATEEQLDFARFRLELEARIGQGRCLPANETERLVRELFTRHGLEGWTLRLGEPYEGAPAPAGNCLTLYHYMENEQEVWVGPTDE